MGAVGSELGYPILGCAYFRSVNDETLSGWVVGGGGQQILDIGIMGEFSLSVGADDFSPEGGLKEAFFLFLVAEAAENVEEHD